jgi:hypothetical protein
VNASDALLKLKVSEKPSQSENSQEGIQKEGIQKEGIRLKLHCLLLSALYTQK